MFTLACIKWGTKYPPYYVNRLYEGLQKNIAQPFSLFCMTDDPTGIEKSVHIIPLPVEPFSQVIVQELAKQRRKGAFQKISLFKPDLFPKGPVLGLDLDIVITGPIDEFFTYAPGKVCMRREWRAERVGRPDGHGSVFRFDPSLHTFLYEQFLSNPLESMKQARYSEQKYTSMQAQKYGEFAYFPGDWIASYKRDAMHPFPINYFLEPKLPQRAKVICFHGRPKMEEAIGGYRDGLFRTARACKWLKEKWMTPAGT